MRVVDLTRLLYPWVNLHNGIEGGAGHFIGSVSSSVVAKMMNLGAPVVPPGARGSGPKVSKYNRQDSKKAGSLTLRGFERTNQVFGVCVANYSQKFARIPEFQKVS